MRLSIFARFIISYLFLFSMLAGVSLYFIYHLNRFNQITHSIIAEDNSFLEYSNQLTDTLLLEVRNDRKYVVLKDEELFHSYLQAKNEFQALLEKALKRANSEALQQIFYNIAAQHRNLSNLVISERELIKSATEYSLEKFTDEKKNISDDIIEKLKQVRQTSEVNIFNKILNLSDSHDRARKLFIVIAAVVFSTGLIVAFVITRSIKKPLDLMRAKTVKISQGNFQGDLKIHSPPVISELATAINTMCHKLQEVDDMKSDFFSHMSHELRTPLTSIKEGTSMLIEGLGGEVNQKQKRILNIIFQESNRLIEQVNALLDLTKMEAGMLKYDFSPIDLLRPAKVSLEVLAPLAEAKKITIKNRLPHGIAVMADYERILQVFRNLIGNAIKFTPENGTIMLDGTVNKGLIEVGIHDSGIGIDEEDLERIFNKFQQITSKDGQKVKGTGLGLATVKQIILAHGGKVWAKSRIGQGSTFYFSLPLVSQQ